MVSQDRDFKYTRSVEAGAALHREGIFKNRRQFFLSAQYGPHLLTRMNVISHIVYPVVFAQSANIYGIHKRNTRFFHWKYLLLIGLCGGLPDILSPHLALGARYNSFTHSLWFLLVTLVSAFFLARKFQKYKTVIYFCWFAVLFHLLCDMVAGGINLLAPFGEMIIGRHYLPFDLWIPLDIAGVLFLIIPPLYNRCPVRI